MRGDTSESVAEDRGLRSPATGRCPWIAACGFTATFMMVPRRGRDGYS
jgi:hypothetical protein